jgi:hypothetical protein
MNLIIGKKYFFIDRRRPAQTGANRRRPAQTGADRRRPAQTGANRLFSVTPLFIDLPLFFLAMSTVLFACRRLSSLVVISVSATPSTESNIIF